MKINRYFFLFCKEFFICKLSSRRRPSHRLTPLTTINVNYRKRESGCWYINDANFHYRFFIEAFVSITGGCECYADSHPERNVLHEKFISVYLIIVYQLLSAEKHSCIQLMDK